MLTVLDHLPEALLNCEASELHKHLQGPTLIHLQGRDKSPLFLSVLLHGNEDTGWCAVRRLLNKYQGKKLPRDLSIYIGNVEAARFNARYLDQQPDYNRIWRVNKSDQLKPEHKMMQQVTNIMRQRKPFASIDIHNNTGINPHYACVNRLDQPAGPSFFSFGNLVQSHGGVFHSSGYRTIFCVFRILSSTDSRMWSAWTGQRC